MAFDIQRAKASTPGAAQKQIDTSIVRRSDALARTVGAAGGQLKDTAIVLNDLQVENELSEGKRQVSEILQQLADGFEREIDSKKYPDMAKEAKEAIAQIEMGTGKGKRLFGRFAADIGVEIDGRVLESGREREWDTMRSNVAQSMALGQYEKARGQIKKAMELGAFSKEQSVKLIATTFEDQAEFDKASARKTLTDWALQQETEKEALDLVRDQGLKNGMDKDEITFIQGQVKSTFEREEQEQGEKQERNADEFLVRIARGKNDLPTPDELISALKSGDIDSTRFKSLLTRLTKRPTSDDPESRFNMIRSITSVGNGTKSIREGRDDLIRNSTGLTDDTLATMSERLAKEIDTSQDGAYSKTYARAEDQLVSITLSTLDQLLEGLKAAEGKENQDFAKLKLTTAKESRKLELDNLRRYDDAMLAWRKKNTDASPDEILREGTRKLLVEFAPKTMDDIRADRTAEVGSLSPIKVRKPNGEIGFIPRELLPVVKTQKGWEILNGEK